MKVVGRKSIDGTSIDVAFVGDDAAVQMAYPLGTSGLVMEVYFRSGAVRPKVGDRLSVWKDGTTEYAMASR